MKTSPTQRSLKLLRAAGNLVAITEHWNQFAHLRQDLFGFGDLIWCNPKTHSIGLVQTTSGSNQAARLTKIIGIPAARTWLESGGRIEVHGWRKAGARGERKLWCCNVREVTLADLPVEEFALTS